MKLHAKVIVNPAAGANSTHRKWPGIRSLLNKSGLSFDFQFTEGKGHGIELARAAASDGYRYLVAVGGDGTIHEVVNGLFPGTPGRPRWESSLPAPGATSHAQPAFLMIIPAPALL
jgi:diacylglycerol kinase family enzyme